MIYDKPICAMGTTYNSEKYFTPNKDASAKKEISSQRRFVELVNKFQNVFRKEEQESRNEVDMFISKWSNKSSENIGSYHKYHSKSKLRYNKSVAHFSHKKPKVNQLTRKHFKLNRVENHGGSIYEKKIVTKSKLKQSEDKVSQFYYTPNRRPASAQKSR